MTDYSPYILLWNGPGYAKRRYIEQMSTGEKLFYWKRNFQVEFNDVHTAIRINQSFIAYIETYEPEFLNLYRVFV